MAAAAFSIVSLLSLAGVVYATSVVVGLALARHTARSWHRSFWCRHPLSRLAGWHPVCTNALHRYGDPYRAPSEQDLKDLLLFAVIPLANTALVVHLLVGCPAVAAMAWMQHQLTRHRPVA